MDAIMKQRFISIELLFLIFFIPYSYGGHTNSFVLTGPYLGQKPPGITPEIFAPGIINTKDKNHSSVAVSPDGREIYWSIFSTIDGIRQERVWYMVMADKGLWSEPGVAPFSGKYRDGQPSFSPDGKKIYFSSLRPVDQNDDTGDANIWVVEKNGDGWGLPRCLDASVNTEHQEWFPSVARNGNLYYALKTGGKGTSWNIHAARFKSGKYENPESLGDAINSRFNEMTPYIDPDERFIIFFSERPTGNFIDGRLHISYRNADGSWGEAKNMGKSFNTSTTRFPNISRDGKYFFFTKLVNGSEDVYWVDAGIIKKLRPIN
jgi:Tol biopolymer transport system component